MEDMALKIFASIVLLFVSAFPSGSSAAQETNPPDPKTGVELIGVAEIPGTAQDLSGMSEALDADSTNDQLGGFSGIDFTGQDNTYLLVSDRGPKDGAVDWTCRFQCFRISIDPDSRPAVKPELLETVLLTNEEGLRFTGLASAYVKSEKQSGRFDPEGIRVAPNGNILISDEYGPRLIEFSPAGKWQREFSVPARYLIARPGLDKSDENPANESGRQTNRGMEGLAITVDGSHVFGLMQSPLLQDSLRRVITDKPAGLNCRLLQFAISGEVEKEMLYHLDDNDNKLNEILACGNNTALVIERDGEAGADARYKKLMLISTEKASDISHMDALPPMEIPDHVQPVTKRVLIDLLDPRWGLAGEKMPEKIEGLAFGPNLPDGRRTLLVTSDNDFERDKPSYIYAFAVPPALLDRVPDAASISKSSR
jgi:hypothetical protein